MKMFENYRNTVVLLVILVCQIQITVTQATSSNPDTCTYSFMVSQSAKTTSCQLDTNAEQINGTIKDLEDRILQLTHNAQEDNTTFTCECASEIAYNIAYTDCEDVKRTSEGVSGVYDIMVAIDAGPILVVEDVISKKEEFYISIDSSRNISVFCDLSSDDAGWTVIMRRTNFNVNFNRTWDEYKDGFGDLDGDFWLGLQNMHDMTFARDYSLWIVINDERHVSHILPYDSFRVGAENNGFPIIALGYHGSEEMFDFLADYRWNFNVPGGRGIPFITKDTPETILQKLNDAEVSVLRRPNYRKLVQCSNYDGGGWWSTGSRYYSYTRCPVTNLNSIQPHDPEIQRISKVEMKMLPHF